jgi:hypothetical protein
LDSAPNFSRLLADYGDRYGSASRFLENVERYCRETADLSVDLVPGINRFNTPADERDLLLFNIRFAKEQLRCGTYPGDVLRDIASSYQHLSLALGRFTGGGLRQKKNFSAPREPDRYITSRDEWIQKRVDALLNDGLRLTPASKLVMGELGGELTDKQIRNICHRAGIGSRRSLQKKAEG